MHKVGFGSNSEVWVLYREVGFALNSGHRQPRLAGPKRADTVAKLFLGWRTKIPKAADASYARRREGPDHIVSFKIDHGPSLWR